MSSLRPNPLSRARELGASKSGRAAAIAAGVAALVIVVAVGLMTLSSLRTLVETRAMVNHTYDVLAALDAERVALDEAESSQRGFIITGFESSLGKSFNSPRMAMDAIAELRRLTRDNPQQQRTLDTLETLARAKLALIDQTIALRRASGFDDAAAIVRTGRGIVLMGSIRAAIEMMKNRELALLEHRRARESESLQRAGTASRLGLATATVLALFAGLLVFVFARARRDSRIAAAQAQTLVEATSDGIYGLDAEGYITFANRAMAEQLGYRPEEMVGQRAHALFHHSYADGTPYPAKDCPMYKLLQEGDSSKVSDELIWKRDGTFVPVEYVVNRLTDVDGSVGAVVSFRDITDRQLAEAALRKGKEAAEMANTAKSDFLARMSHELRTPLNSVIGFANVLLRNKAGNLREQDLTYLERIQKNGVNLLGLINDILDLSKIEAGRMEVELRPTDIGTVVRDVIAQFEPIVAAKNIKLVASVPPELAVIQSDPARLEQILVNLVANAIKFTERGEVRVTVRVDSNTTQPVSVEVRDSGIGIPPERIDAIFTPFEQAEKSTTRRYGGTGLGLPISRSLCELLGYNLRVESRLGEGSTFIVEIRRRATRTSAATEILPAPDEQARTAASALTGKQVLVIDDDADARMLIAHQVAQLGGTAIGAASGEEAIQKARESLPDLVTLDLLMPEMDGRQVLQKMKSDPLLRHIPVVIVSHVAREQGGGLVGAVSVLSKPLDGRLLAQAARSASGVGRVLIVDDDPDTQHLLASYVHEEGASEVRVIHEVESAIAALDTFRPDLVLLDLVMPGNTGESFLRSIASDPPAHPLSVIVVTGKELSAGELRALEFATVGVVQKGASLEERLRTILREVSQKRRGTPPFGSRPPDV
ncbi:MAG: response regulator [Gemmatimonadaceae bacterium]|nr:response regulator [Gemmatimonadaceae bacterium]